VEFAYGYGKVRLTLAEMEQRTKWNKLHPEFRRRLHALFVTAREEGVDVGIGGGYRSTERQKAMFLSRYVQDPNGRTRWDGKRWTKKRGVASAAPPGRSYHEPTDSEGWCYAADLVGDLNWANANAHRFDLLHFANVNSEPWHFQPVELPKSRSRYSGQVLEVWNPPEPPNNFTPDPITHITKDLDMRLVKPARLFDSRSKGGPFKAGETRDVRVADVSAAFVNITVVPYEPGFVTVWDAGNMPNVSNVNYVDAPIANTSLVPVENGHIKIYSSGKADIIIDIQATA